MFKRNLHKEFMRGYSRKAWNSWLNERVKRTVVGDFKIENAITVEELKEK